MTKKILEIKDFPRITEDDYEHIPKEYWQIMDTISEQSYYSHNYIRYYGKFIPEIARRLITRYSSERDLVIDNMMGSGTSLVEAMLLDRDAIGFDINPVSVFSAKVKTTIIDPSLLKQKMNEILKQIENLKYSKNCPEITFDNIEKWFNKDIQHSLACIREIIWGMDEDDLGDFFKLAFASIIRRLSKAYDGEVRPRINKKKKQQNPREVYIRKLSDMINRMEEIYNLKKTFPEIRQAQSDARNLVIDGTPVPNQSTQLIISHPPYLNSFNYAHALNLVTKYMGLNYKEILGSELKVHPATNGNLVYNFFVFIKEMMIESHRVLKDGGFLAIVIGDCTVRGAVIEEHKRIMEIGKSVGFKLYKLIFRKPYYSTGAYSYQERVYNYEHIIIFQK